MKETRETKEALLRDFLDFVSDCAELPEFDNRSGWSMQELRILAHRFANQDTSNK